MSELRTEQVEGISFVGSTLGLFFLKDPKREAIDVAAAYEVFAELDAAGAAESWPFVDAALALPALQLMRDGARMTEGDAITWEYRRLFVGPEKKAAPPWGSVYTDRECVVFGESTLALRQWMRASGIERLGGQSDPEDHIGLMLMLMTWIAQHRPELLDEFLRDHLLTWAGHFLVGMKEAAQHPFFEGLASLTRQSLEGIQRERGIDVAYPRFYR